MNKQKINRIFIGPVFMHLLSNNYGKLKNILTFPSGLNRSQHLFDYSLHQKSMILAKLLVNATLATPRLDRDTVNALLSGDMGWPDKNWKEKEVCKGIDIETLEKLGLISFHQNYCSVFLRYVRNFDDVHETVKPYLNAVEKIKEIMAGDGFIKPHFKINVLFANRILDENIVSINLDDIKEIKRDGDDYRIEVDYENARQMLPEYLWKEISLINQKKICTSSDGEYVLSGDSYELFDRWVLLTRVYSSAYLCDVDIEFLKENSKEFFIKNAINVIDNDEGIKKSKNEIKAQWINEADLSATLFYTSQTSDFNANSSLPAKEDQLSTAIVSLNISEFLEKKLGGNDSENISNVQLVAKNKFLERECPASSFSEFFGLPRKIAALDVFIDHYSINSHGALDNLFVLAKNRYALRHILLNRLPHINNIDYILYLLSKPETASAAFYLLSEYRESSSNNVINNSRESLHHVYAPIVCDEFIRVALKNQNASNKRELVDLLICLTKECFTEYFKGELRVKKDFLDALLNKISLSNLAFVSEELFSSIGLDKDHRANCIPVWKFYILFWLLEKCQDYGFASGGGFEARIEEAICEVYSEAFRLNFNKEKYPFSACWAFDFLPWERVKGKLLKNILDVIKDHRSIMSSLSPDNEYYSCNMRLLGNYFHILVCLFSKKRSLEENKKIVRKILWLIECYGFSEGESVNGDLFDYDGYKSYPLWRKFSSTADSFEDNDFNNIIEIFKERKISIDRIYEFYHGLNRDTRKKKVLSLISMIPHDFLDEHSIVSIENALKHSFFLNQLDVADVLLKKGFFLFDDPKGYLYGKKTNKNILSIYNRLIAYRYRFSLSQLYFDASLTNEQKITKIKNIENPYENESLKDNADLYRYCNNFFRTIVGACYVDIAPEIAYKYFESLYNEDKSIQSAGNRFISKIKFLGEKKYDIQEYKTALLEWENSIKDSDIKDIVESFIVCWLEVLVKIDDQEGIDSLWNSISECQKNSVVIATIFCKFLVKKGDHYSALSIFEKLKCHHEYSNLGKEAEDQLNQLNNLIVEGTEPVTIAAITKIIVNSPKTSNDLIKNYQEILSKNISDLVSIITSGEKNLEKYLYDQISSILSELSIRKKFLNLHKPKNEPIESYKITNENYINSWFTSLFKHKHSHLNIPCEEQKMAGESETGDGPGEIDFYIGDRSGDRIAIIEAFKLNNNNTTVINKHLNKIAGYDQECLSPVFILIYCDVKDFEKLCSDYFKDTLVRRYDGFLESNRDDDKLGAVEPPSATMAKYREVKYRGTKPISIYHLMVNLRFSV